MANVNKMFYRMRLYYEMIKEIRLDVLRQGSYDPSCPKGTGRGKQVLKPNIGDIVIVCNLEKHNDAKFGVVEGFRVINHSTSDSEGIIKRKLCPPDWVYQ